MPTTVTLLIEPLPAESTAVELAKTFYSVNADEPALRVGELSTQRGDGIFETLAVVNGHVQEVEAHLARLRNSALICELPEPNLAQWRAAVKYAVAELPAMGEFALKLVLSRGVENGPTPTAWVHAVPAADFSTLREHGIRAVTLNRGMAHDAAVTAPWLLLGAKTLSYAVNMAALREAHRRAADDVIFTSADGYLMEGPTSSLIIRIGEEYLTPAASGAILPGTTQASVFKYLENAGRRTGARDIRVSELAAASAIWLVSSVRLAVGVIELDGAAVPYDAVQTAELNSYLLSARG